MTRALPFTEHSLARLIKGVEKAGLFVIGVRPDGTLIVGDKPVDLASLILPVEQPSPAAVRRRMGEYFHGGSSEAEGA
jgi:hypothetical protein